MKKILGIGEIGGEIAAEIKAELNFVCAGGFAPALGKEPERRDFDHV